MAWARKTFHGRRNPAAASPPDAVDSQGAGDGEGANIISIPTHTDVHIYAANSRIGVGARFVCGEVSANGVYCAWDEGTFASGAALAPSAFNYRFCANCVTAWTRAPQLAAAAAG